MITLGSMVRDKITGLTGIAVCRTDWLHGCCRIGVQSQQLHDGKPIDPQYFDEPQLEVVTEEPKRDAPATGGPRNDPSSRRAGE